MRKSNTQSLGEVITEYIEALKLKGKFQEVQIVKYWEELMGKTIMRSTSEIFIQNKVLYVHMNSSVIRHELFMMRKEIVKKINERAGQKIVNMIVLK